MAWKPPKINSSLEEAATNRADFMKRWFAVAVSVGFATTVARMPWLATAEPFDPKQAEQSARLLVAVLATVLSWDGYLLSISKKKLYDLPRFFIDVGLVFIYLVLLLSSVFADYWLFIHAVSFVVYLLWDFLSIAQYRNHYVLDNSLNPSNISVTQVYVGSFLDRSGIDRGPSITFMWGLYFVALWLLYPIGFGQPTFFYAAFVGAGLLGYRIDKTQRSFLWQRILAFSTLGIVGTVLAYLF